MMQKDSAGHSYLEFDAIGGEHIRVTKVPAAEWSRQETIRIQKRTESGSLMQGPEIPVSALGDLAKALHDVIRDA